MTREERVAITVGLGEARVSSDPQDELVALGLGSCVGVCAYDPVAKVGGLLHAMLPEANGSDGRPAKYVDTGIRHLLEEMERRGARRSRIRVHLVGGAQMLIAPGFGKALDIGARNVARARLILPEEGLTVVGADVGGSKGRTVRLHVGSGIVRVRSVGGTERELCPTPGRAR